MIARVPMDMGYWRVANGQRRLLAWDPTTGALTLDGDLIAVCADADHRLSGWAEHCDLRDGLGWVATQLKGCR